MFTHKSDISFVRVRVSEMDAILANLAYSQILTLSSEAMASGMSVNLCDGGRGN